MSTISLHTGRKKQKLQTRQNILETTQKLLLKKNDLSLEDVAKASGISRATIYRYFSNIDVLCSEAGLDINTKTPETIYLEVQDLEVVERILYIQNYFNDLAINNEQAFRKYLSIYLKEDTSGKKRTSRGSRRTAALELALNFVKKDIDANTYTKLIRVATSLMGIESIITSKDVCNLNNRETKDALAWGLKTILQTIFKNN